MWQIKQKIFEKGRGDCVKCCICSLFELDYDIVPNFIEEENNDWLLGLYKFLEPYNLEPIYIKYPHPLYQGIDYIATGKSPRSNNNYKTNHAVIYHARNMIFDPHPDNLGIGIFENIILFHPISLNKSLRNINEK